MSGAQHDPSIEDRISRIERSVPVDPPLPGERDRVATLAGRMAHHCTPGLSVAVIHAGEVEWTRGYGALRSDRSKPVTPNTIFHACSISKQVAMVGALRLVQEGMLDLDADVNTYLLLWTQYHAAVD